MNESQVIDDLAKAWKPKEILNIWKWAEKYIVLPSTVTPFPGPFSTNTMPYIREPLEKWGSGGCEILTLCWSAQSGKTTTELISLLYDIVYDTFNSMFVMPTEEMVRAFVSERIEPLIEANPVIKDLLKTGRSDNKTLVKKFVDGKILNFVWSNSATQLSSRTVGKIRFDEVDKYPPNVNREADPISLGRERMKLIVDNQTFITSTVTSKENFVWRYFEQGSQHHFFVSCLKCKFEFCLEWKNVKFDTKNNKTRSEVCQSARIECPKCKHKMDDDDKRGMVEKGVWKATNDNCLEGNLSYRINEIYSPITTLAKLVGKWLEASDEQKKMNKIEKLQNFINSSLSLPFEDDLNKANTIKVIEGTKDLRDRGVVPYKKTMCGLIAGVDTQDNGFYYVIRAYDESMSNWLVSEGFCENLEKLDNILFNTIYIDTEGYQWKVRKAFIDAGGHRAREVYDYSLQNHGLINPIIGRGYLTRDYRLVIVENYPGTNELMKGGLERVDLNVNVYKGMLNRSINKPRQTFLDDNGVFYTHRDIKDNYLKQMTVEFIENGKWECPKGLANHFWDCEVYCLACADFYQIHYRNPKNEGGVRYKPQATEKQGFLGYN